MRQIEEKTVSIDKLELTKHTFVTGSTGSGKSNAVYTLLNKLCPKKEKPATKFLVIEPAKGEYKDIFGGRDDVTTYGTNPFKVPNLLQINPFSFPDDIHVLEHIDRLVVYSTLAGRCMPLCPQYYEKRLRKPMNVWIGILNCLKIPDDFRLLKRSWRYYRRLSIHLNIPQIPVATIKGR
jgi:energy-coupling factor transporter ATP-binding protein EcfA2